MAAIQPMFTRVINELQNMRKELQQLKKERIKIKPQITPAQPFKDMKMLNDFEKRLQATPDNFASFVSFI